MRIGLKNVLNIISTKTGINKKDITFSANFDTLGVDIGKDYDDWRAKKLCVYENRSLGLRFNIYAKGYEIFRFTASDIEPRTNDIYEFMRVDTDLGCIGPGFYSYDPYLILDYKCDKKDIIKFIEAISIDPDETVVANLTVKNSKHKQFIQSLPKNAVGKSFFKNIKSSKFIDASSSENLDDEQTL